MAGGLWWTYIQESDTNTNVCLYEKSMLKCNWENFLNFDGSFLLLSPDHHETVPRFVISFFLFFIDCGPCPLRLSSRPAVSSLLIGAFLLLARHCLKFLLAHWLGVALPCSKANSVSKKSTCVLPKNPLKEHVHDFLVAVPGYIL